jgi:predicted Zn-dependent protease
LKRFFARDSRDHLWAFLDILDARPALKKTLLIGVPAFLVAVGLGAWGYHHWERRNALAIARQWLAAGRLDRAGEAVQEAIATEPGQPQSWRLASELAWEKGNKVASVEYAKKAAVVGGYREDDVLAWAEASILADDADEAQEAEAYLDRAAALNSPRALRLAGEIARRAGNFATARTQFEAALRADTDAGVADLAADEVPLGIVCLQTGSAADRTRGRALLAKWASNAKWGADALRALLADAEARGDSKVTAQCAEALSVHPRCTLGDIPVCLQALAGSDRDRYQAMLAVLEEKSRATPTESAQLLGWLTKIGQGEEAVRWGQSLEPAAARKPPIAPGIAEALRSTQRWADLQAWVKLSDWGKDVGFLEMAYGMTAARHLGDGPNADLLLQSLNTDAALSPAHALFAGDALYAWGYPREAAALLWIAADQPDLAYQALGSLARLYQVQRDAAGQYRTFSRLNAMRPSDSDIANNYAYFAALTDLGSQTHIERIAADNFAREPGNVIYRSTDAFVLVWSGQASRALELMEPVASEAKKSPAVAFAYGAALAGVGRRDEAREIFNSLNPRNLSPQEIDWIQAALR